MFRSFFGSSSAPPLSTYGYSPLETQTEKREASKLRPVINLFFLFLSLWFILVLGLSAFPQQPYFTTLRGRVNAPSLAISAQQDVHMPQLQCQREFPLLYTQLYENAKVWRTRGGVKKAYLDEAMDKCRLGCMRFIVKDGLIYVKRFAHPMQTRVQEVVALFKKAIDAAPWEDLQAFDGVEMVMNAFDFEDDVVQNHAAWLLTKKVENSTHNDGQYLLPDFGFGAWPEAGIGTYEHFRREVKLLNDEYPWARKGDRAFFRGDPYVGEHGNSARKDLITQIHKPGAEEWADVARTSFGGTTSGGEPIKEFVRIEDHCKHKYLLHSEGVSYSGRSKFILGCQSTVITHNLQWTQHFHPALNADESSPDQNIIISPGHDFEKLAPLMLDLQEQDRRMVQGGKASKGFRVAQNAKRTLVDRYLTPAALACYVRGALISYSSVLDRSSFNEGRGPQVERGGGVAQYTGLKPLHELKEHLHGDMDSTTWAALGHPEYPV